MSAQSYIFIGRSGCGKGTQGEMLAEVIRKQNPDGDVIYIQTGQELRDFIKGDSFTQKKSREIYEKGGLEPEFLTVHMWVRVLSEKFKPGSHLIFDGTPRKLHEAGVLDSIFEFYDLDKPWVINIDISPEETIRRLLLRKRQDDNEDDIKQRLSWYESDVIPTVEYYMHSTKYNFLKIDGERPVEVVHQDILKKVGLI